VLAEQEGDFRGLALRQRLELRGFGGAPGLVEMAGRAGFRVGIKLSRSRAA